MPPKLESHDEEVLVTAHPLPASAISDLPIPLPAPMQVYNACLINDLNTPHKPHTNTKDSVRMTSNERIQVQNVMQTRSL